MTQPNASHGDAAPLSPENWAHVRALVEEALTLPREARPAFLTASCGDDDALRDRVERLAAGCERAGESWGFLAHPAGELVAPLLVADGSPLADASAVGAELPLRRRLAGMVLARLSTALADRYRIERELGAGGMATVYLAFDVRHGRQVAIKVLRPELSAVLGTERFLSEIKTTAALQHPHILPLFDSGAADELLFYVMPLVDGETLRARITHEKQLPVADAVRIASEVAGALDYAHRHGVIHRDIKPENILLHEGRSVVADFGIALAVQSAGAERMTLPGISLGTPQYMSPEQAASYASVDGRSDIYSLACVLYELLVGDPPFTGSTVQAVIAKVISEPPSSVRIVRPSVPAHVDAAVLRALAKLPADRFATAGEFADALVSAPMAVPTGARANAARWRNPTRLVLGAVAAVGLVSAAWMALGTPAAPVETTKIPYRNLIDQSITSSVTITPDGRALVYTGSAEAGRPIMLLPLDQLAARALSGTEEGHRPVVAPSGRRLAFFSSVEDKYKTVSIDGVAFTDAADVWWKRWWRQPAWRYGNGAWVGDSVIVTEDLARGLSKRVPGGVTLAVLTRPDTAHGESKHSAPLLLPGRRSVVFTVGGGGPALVTGPLAIASLDPGKSLSPHVLLGVRGRRAVAFVDGRLLFTSENGRAIMAVRLDVDHQRIVGTPVSVLEDERGDLETGSVADNGTLLYVRRPRANWPVLVDASGAVRPGLAGVEGSFMNPRISPDGKHIAVQARGATGGNDVWVYDIASRTPAQLTTTGSAITPTWTPDGRRIVFAAAGGKGLMSQLVDGSAPAEKVVESGNVVAPVVTPDGRSVVFQRRAASGWSVWSASLRGSGAPRKVVDDAGTLMPAVSPDGDLLVYVSNATGRNEVYVRRLLGPGTAKQVSVNGGTEPAWSPDGRHIYYRAKDAFMSVVVSPPTLAITSSRQLFKDAFDGAMPHRNYDVTPDGTAFLMITGASSEAVVVLNWLTDLRARLARER